MTSAPVEVKARKAGFLNDLISVAERALRSIPRDPEGTIPPLIFPVFFFAMAVGSLQVVAEEIPGLDFKAFQLPVAIIFAVTGVSRAIVLVTDIQSGYFDRLSLTPANRLALLLGLMMADFALVSALTVPVLIMGLIVGVNIETGVLGFLALILMTGIWGVVFTGFPYAIALKTGNVATVNVSFLLFFPFLFMTPVFLPREAMTGWMATVAGYNPITYVLDALRSLLIVGWDWEVLGKGMLSILGVGVVSIGLALAALKGRATRK